MTWPQTSQPGKVMAYPCGHKDEIWLSGPMLSDLYGSTPSAKPQPHSIRWEGIEWRVAWNAGTLWVLAPQRDMVDAHRPSLERLSAAVANTGGDVQRVAREGAKPQTLVPVRIVPDKDKALDQVTEAVGYALKHGASMAEIRLAVFGAMGLDSEPST